MRRAIPRPLLSMPLTFCLLFTTSMVRAQEKPAANSGGSEQTPQIVPQSDRDVSVPKLPANILDDQKLMLSFPKTIAHGEHIWPTIGILGVTAGFIASDPYSAPPFRTTTSFSSFNRIFSSGNTAAFIAVVPGAMYGVGWLRKDSYAEDTALLSGEAVADGFILDIPFKAITGRKQPVDYFGSGPYSDSFFMGSHNPFRSGGFYSEHAMAATAVATVIARRYRNHRWVPYLAYGLATAISFSKITRSDHFPADVFVGGAMGYVIARYTVLPSRD